MTPTATHAASATATQPLPGAVGEPLLGVPAEHLRAGQGAGGADQQQREQR